MFILKPGTDRYLGRLCDFNACPKGKAECRVPGCRDVRGVPKKCGAQTDALMGVSVVFWL